MSTINLTSAITIKPDHNNRKGLFSGHINYKTNELVTATKVVITITQEAKGEMSSFNRKLIHKIIMDDTFQISPIENYSLPFDFKINSNIETYKGHNVDIFYTCEIKTYIDDESWSRLNRDTFEGVKAFFSTIRSIKTTKRFNYYIPNKQLKVKPLNLLLDIKPNKALYIPLGILIFSICFIAYPDKSFNSFFFSGMIALFSSTYISKALLQMIYPTQKGLIEEHIDGFNFTILSKPSSSHKKYSIYYQIIEKVIDKRGSSNSTLENVLYTSPKTSRNKSNILESNDFKSPPKNKYFHSTKIDDASIIYQIHVTTETKMGFNIVYYHEFTMLQT